jgi:hypothetical protein
MTSGMNAALRRQLAGSALGGLIALAAVPAAMAQWLPPWRVVVPARAIAGRLEAQGYMLIAPLQRRPGVYLADVRAGPAGYQRLVIDDRSGEILERFMSRPRSSGPEFANRYDQFEGPPFGSVQPQFGPRFSDAPSAGPAVRSASGGPADVHIPSVISPYGSRPAPASTKPQPVTAARKTPVMKTGPAAVPPVVTPPLPPPAPREAAKPDESAPPAPKLEPKIESPPGETDNASTVAAPLAPEVKPEQAKIEPQPEAQTQPSAAPDPTATAPALAPSAEASEKSKISIVPAPLFE